MLLAFAYSIIDCSPRLAANNAFRKAFPQILRNNLIFFGSYHDDKSRRESFVLELDYDYAFCFSLWLPFVLILTALALIVIK